MKFSARRYKVGDVVMLRSCKGAAYLPDEIPDKSKAKVLFIDIGRVDVEFKGRTYNLSPLNVDTGYETFVNGRWEIYWLPGEDKPLAKWQNSEK